MGMVHPKKETRYRADSSLFCQERRRILMGKPFKDKLKNVGDFISGTIAEEEVCLWSPIYAQ